MVRLNRNFVQHLQIEYCPRFSTPKDRDNFSAFSNEIVANPRLHIVDAVIDVGIEHGRKGALSCFF